MKNEQTLMERRERLMADLQKMQRRVDGFADYGELEMMAEYAQDVKQVQKKIVEVENEIEWINQVGIPLLLASERTDHWPLFRKKRNSACRRRNILSWM